MKVLRLRALCLSLSAVSLSVTLCSALFGSATKTDVPASMEPRVVVCLGDSLTAGYGLDQAQAYPALLQKSIDSLGWKFKVVNAGLSGETTAGGLRRLDWVLKRRIDVLILAWAETMHFAAFPSKPLVKISTRFSREPVPRIRVSSWSLLECSSHLTGDASTSTDSEPSSLSLQRSTRLASSRFCWRELEANRS